MKIQHREVHRIWLLASSLARALRAGQLTICRGMETEGERKMEVKSLELQCRQVDETRIELCRGDRGPEWFATPTTFGR